MSHHHHQQQQQQHFFVYLRACSFASSIKNIRLRAVSCWGLCSAHILTLLYCSVFLCVCLCVWSPLMRQREIVTSVLLWLCTYRLVFSREREKQHLKTETKQRRPIQRGRGDTSIKGVWQRHITRTRRAFIICCLLSDARASLSFFYVWWWWRWLFLTRKFYHNPALCVASQFLAMLCCARARASARTWEICGWKLPKQFAK